MDPVVVAGLGVSGLGCAAELVRQKVPFLALEKEDRAGGLARTDAADGFLFDQGPHILLGIPGELHEFFRDLEGLDLAECSGRSGIAMDTHLDCVVPAPFQRNLRYLPLALRARLLFRLLTERFRSRKSLNNYEEYATAQCGRDVYDLFVRGYDSKRLRFPLDQIPANWTSRLERTSIGSLLRSKEVTSGNGNGHREARFLYPRSGGIEALPKAMARLLPETSVCYGSEVVEIRPEAKLVILANGESVRYRHLVLSLPLPETVALIGNPPPEIRRAAANLIYTSIYVINAGVEGPVPPWTLLRVPDAEVGFYRVSFPTQYAADCAPSGLSTVVGEVSHHPTRYPLSSREAGRLFRAGLERLGIVRHGQRFVFEHIRDIRYGHIVYNSATQAGIQLILEYLSTHAISACGKYGLWRDMLIPQSILSGMNAAQSITARS